MEQNVKKVIAQGRIPPQFVPNPKDGTNQRMVLMVRVWLDPDAFQTTRRTRRWCNQIQVIIPDPFPVPSRLVRSCRSSDQDQGKKPVPRLLRECDSHQ